MANANAPLTLLLLLCQSQRLYAAPQTHLGAVLIVDKVVGVSPAAAEIKLLTLSRLGVVVPESCSFKVNLYISLCVD